VTTDSYGRFGLPESTVGSAGLASYQGFDDSQPVYLELGTGNLFVLSRLGSISGG
jgi:hypothetical protein